MNAFIFAFMILTTLLIVRVALVDHYIKWLTRFVSSLTTKYVDDVQRRANIKVKTVKEENQDDFVKQIEKELSYVDNIWKVLDLYPSYMSLVFSLNKWTKDQMFPMLTLSMALALSDKIDNIDEDMLR